MITVRHDNKLSFPQIRVPIYNEDNDEGPQMYNQTDIEGVLVPLLKFNETVITFEQVDYMELTCNPVPRIEVRITDFLQIIRILDQPGHDNMLYLQILPPFDDAYKKIQLSFHIDHSDVSGNQVTLIGSYYIPKLYDSVMKPYGYISTYDLFEQVANDYSLGFCSNVTDTKDERYIYNPSMDMISFLNREVEYAGEKHHVFTWWVDFWNNINLVDIFTEYNEVLSDDDMQVWVSDNFKDINEESKPYQQVAAFTNNPAMVATPMFVPDYTSVLSTAPVTDANFEIFSMNTQEVSSTVIQDGDVSNDIFMQYRYGGELFGDFDYLSQRACRNMFLNKISATGIEVTATYPMLGLIKGGHVNVWWYDMNNIMLDGLDMSELKSNAPIPNDPDGSLKLSDMTIVPNPTVSGQYYIMDVKYIYQGHRNWEIEYKLGRSEAKIERLAPPTKETFVK